MNVISGAIGVSRERTERNAVLVLVGLIWLAILGGFGPEIARRLASHAVAFPLLVHLHAFAFVGWLVLLTVQVMLIRNNRRDIHRQLGVVGAVLAASMVVLGPMTAFYMDRIEFGTPKGDTPFLITQLTDIIAFAGLVAAAIVWRNRPASHKRLILLATIYITDAGFGRIISERVENLFGSSFLPYVADEYLGPDLLIASIGIYDLCTRRRLYPAYVLGCTWVLIWQVMAGALYFAPFWKATASALLGHPVVAEP